MIFAKILFTVPNVGFTFPGLIRLKYQKESNALKGESETIGQNTKQKHKSGPP